MPPPCVVPLFLLSLQSVRQSVCLSVRLSVCPSVRLLVQWAMLSELNVLLTEMSASKIETDHH